MRALLVNPPPYRGVAQVREGRCMQRRGAWTSVWPPLSLALTAAVLRRAGHQVRLIDAITANLSLEQLAAEADGYGPGLCIVNTATPSIDGDVAAAAAIKGRIPSCRTALIGIHPAALPDETFALSPLFDAIVRGEPEAAALDLASAQPLASIPGISFRTARGIRHNPDRAPIAGLDRLPFPAWDLIDIGGHRMPLSGEPFLLVPTGRGCPRHCRFCADHAYYGRRLRLFTPERIVDEIEHDLTAHGVRQFLFWAESFTLNRQHALTTAEELIRRRLSVGWVCNSRVDQVDPELLAAFRRAGCWMIGYGFESGSQRVLDLMGKGTTLAQAELAVDWAHRAGLQVTGHLMLGYPGETEQDIRQTINFAKGLRLDFAQFYAAVPFPGSDLYRQAVTHGWLTCSDWSRFEQNYSVLNAGQVLPSAVERLRRQAYRSFYLRPSQIIRTVRNLRTTGARRQALAAALDFGSWAR